MIDEGTKKRVGVRVDIWLKINLSGSIAESFVQVILHPITLIGQGKLFKIGFARMDRSSRLILIDAWSIRKHGFFNSYIDQVNQLY